jgi:hypothetical protein
VGIGWLPLTDESQQAAANTAFQDAFAVLVTTVNPGVTAGQQATLSGKLTISSSQPPFEAGTKEAATLAPERYVLEAVDVAGQPGPVTIIGARSVAR